MFTQEETGNENGWLLYPPLSDAVSRPSLAPYLLIALCAVLVFTAIAYTLYRSKRYTLLKVWSAGFVSTGSVSAFIFYLAYRAGLPQENFFSAEGGGEPVAGQHYFWFFGHIEIYVLILKLFLVCFGLLWSAGKLIRGRYWLGLAVLGLGMTAFVVWSVNWFWLTQALFAEGIGPESISAFGPVLVFNLGVIFGLGVILFNLRGRLTGNSVARLFLANGLVFALGGFFVGYKMAGSGVDSALHDTYYVVANTQYWTVLCAVFFVFAAVYAFWPKLTGVAYHRKLALLHWLTFTIGAVLVFAPHYFLGTSGMPKRYVAYDATAYESWDTVASIGYYVTLISALLFAITLFEAISRRIRNGKEPLDADDRPDTFF